MPSKVRITYYPKTELFDKMAAKKRESVYEFKERYDDLNRAYKEAHKQGHYETQYEAMAVAVNMPSCRFWVSAERLSEVIAAFDAGNDIRVSHRSPRYEMYEELYKRYLAYKAEHPDMNKIDICEEVIWQPAPKFYMRPSWGLKILYRGREKRPRKHHHRKNETE